MSKNDRGARQGTFPFNPEGDSTPGPDMGMVAFDLGALELDETEAQLMKTLAGFYSTVYGRPVDGARLVGLAAMLAVAGLERTAAAGDMPELVDKLRLLDRLRRLEPDRELERNGTLDANTARWQAEDDDLPSPGA